MRNYRRHTVESLTEELEVAQKRGAAREVTDLALLIRHLREPKTLQPPEVAAARNRQGARRVQRSYRDPAFRSAPVRPRVGDLVRAPDGQEFRLERIERKSFGNLGWGHFDDGSSVNCPTNLLVVVGSEPEPTAPPVDRFREPAERLYAALWDVLEGPDGTRCPPGIEEALRAYEAALEGVA